MSELKAYRFLGIDEIWTDAAMGSLYYSKSEADKVIAEKDAEIAKLKSLKQALMADDLRYRDKIRHQKYKRCLAMAKLCQWKMGVFIYKKEKNEFYYRWHKRWLKIAEQFKEAK